MDPMSRSLTMSSSRDLPAGSPALLRRLNLAAVLRTIRAKGPISRTELARGTSLSKPTVNGAVELLLEQGYIVEGGDGPGTRPPQPGRRPRLLRFAGAIGNVLGIDIGADKVLVLVADLAGEVLSVERRKTGPRERRDPDKLLALVADAAARALETAEVPRERLKAVGVGTPGVVDPASGRVTLAPQLGGWDGIRLASRLEPVFPCPIVVDNEVRLSLLAEQWRGAAHGIDDALLVQIGVAIGSSLLLGGQIDRGADGAAGEIGYLPLFEDGEPREGFGPFEHAVGGAAIARIAQKAAVAAGGATALLELAGGDPAGIDAETVFHAAALNDAVAKEVLEEFLDRLARGIAAVIVVLNPAVVIVGGGVSRAGVSLLEPLKYKIEALVPVAPRVILSQLSDESAALGGVRLALQEVDRTLFDFVALAI
jgi:predicted NBD/HSP70 family sugar kinase